MNTMNLADLTMVQLKDMAKTNGFKGYSSLKKAELIELINSKLNPVSEESSEDIQETIDLTTLSLDELYRGKYDGREKQTELARRADIAFPSKNHLNWTIQYLYNLLKGDEARTKRRAEFRSAFRKDENGWFVATGKDGTRYAFNETKVLVKIGDEPAKMKEVSSLQEGFDTCWDMCRELFGASHKNK